MADLIISISVHDDDFPYRMTASLPLLNPSVGSIEIDNGDTVWDDFINWCSLNCVATNWSQHAPNYKMDHYIGFKNKGDAIVFKLAFHGRSVGISNHGAPRCYFTDS